MDAAEDVRVKGDDNAVDLRKGLEDEGGRGSGAMTVLIGVTELARMEVGRPPGVKDRFTPNPLPVLPAPFRASSEGPCENVGVALFDRLMSVGVAERTGRRE